jgi:hypothetical protein
MQRDPLPSPYIVKDRAASFIIRQLTDSCSCAFRPIYLSRDTNVYDAGWVWRKQELSSVPDAQRTRIHPLGEASPSGIEYILRV